MSIKLTSLRRRRLDNQMNDDSYLIEYSLISLNTIQFDFKCDIQQSELTCNENRLKMMDSNSRIITV